MSGLTFNEFQRQVMALYEEKNFPQALALLGQYGPRFPERQGFLLNWTFCFQAASGDTEASLKTFAQAVAAGHWWGAEILHTDPDLAGLQGHPEFERLVGICEARYQQAQAASRPELRVAAPPEGSPKPYPFVIVLHGYASSAADSAAQWQGLAERGWLVAAAQSSQITAAGLFHWTEAACAEQEIQGHLARLRERYPIDPTRGVLAGFSQGGGLAINLALAGKIPVRGFLAVAPYLQAPETMETLAAQPAPRGWVIAGGQDRHAAVIDAALAELRRRQVPFEEESYPELGHAYPDEFLKAMDRRLAYILNTDTPSL